MKIIIRDALQKFKALSKNQRQKQYHNEQQLLKFVENHPFFNLSLSSIEIVSQIQQKINDQDKNSTKMKLAQVQRQLGQLQLYLNRDTNKAMFSVYQHILKSNQGISYDFLARKLSTDIINISHYCCKLKKMRFVQWEHKKQGVIVYPKFKQKGSAQLEKQSITQLEKQPTFDYQKSFLFRQLTLNENILINVAGSQSILKGGLTNQQIKQKIMKQAENKMVRRTVQGMKNIERIADRQGKVFQFKYKKQTQAMNTELDKKKIQQSSQLIKLQPEIQEYLVYKFPLYKQENLLLQVINSQLKDYYSSIGIKQSKRQCTPQKLNRYISILNHLAKEGPLSECQLRRFIIDLERQNLNNGLMHKRSLVGILQGLKKIELIDQEDSYFYPRWTSVKKKRQRPVQISLVEKQPQPKKKTSQKKFNLQNIKIPMITEKKHKYQIFTHLLVLQVDKAMKRILRKSLHRILYVHRKKQGTLMFESSKNLMHLIFQSKDQNLSTELPKKHSNNIVDFYKEIDEFIDQQGKQLFDFSQVEYQTVKYLRKNPFKGENSLKAKYGKNWKEKFQVFQNKGLLKIDQYGYQTIIPNNVFLL